MRSPPIRHTPKLEDEYWTLVLSLPVIAVVIPGGGHVILSGFDALRHAPDWYQAAVAASIAFAFSKPVARGTRTLFLKPTPHTQIKD